MRNVLDEIVARKRREVEERKQAVPEEVLLERARRAPQPRDFYGKLAARRGASASRLNVIAEFKRASPSRGAIRPGADPAEIARAYQAAGAAALSVLTDGPSFDGSLEHLTAARAAVRLPVLRKDFIIDPYQLLEARAAGADAVLLIAAALDDRTLEKLEVQAFDLRMEGLVEVHDRADMERACRLQPRIIGINNRDLRTLEVSLDTTRRLVELRPEEETLVVSESGFSRREEMEELRSLGVDAFLVGESLMRAPDPGEALRAFTGGPRQPEGGRR